MTKNAKIKLAKKAILNYAQEHYGWGAKYHPDEKDKFDALIDVAKLLDELAEKGGD